MTDNADNATRRSARASHSGSKLLKEAAERVPLDSRRPQLLGDPTRALQVMAGHVDLFAVYVAEGSAMGPRYHLCRIESGGIILGLPSAQCEGQDKQVFVLAVGGPGAEALSLDRVLIDDREGLETWTVRLCSAIPKPAADWGTREAEPGEEIELKAGQQLRGATNGVVWVSVERGEVRLAGTASACKAGDPPLPLASGTWVEALGDACVRVLNGDAVLSGDPWPTMDRFHALAMLCIARHVAAAQDAELCRLHQRTRGAAAHGMQFLSELASVLVSRPKPGFRAEGTDPLLDACRITAQAIGAEIVSPPGRRAAQRGPSDAAEIARASRLRSRRVLLRADWWQRNVGPLVAWHGEAHEPVAILPITTGRYLMVRPGAGPDRPLDAQLAAELSPEAVMFYAPLPALTGSATRLVSFCVQQGYGDVVRILLSALATGILALAAPLITEVLIDSVIPRTELDQLAFCAAGLSMVAIGAAGFQVLQYSGMRSLEGRLDRILQAGIIDRMLRLPVSFLSSTLAKI